jgi:hypothetical protein
VHEETTGSETGSFSKYVFIEKLSNEFGINLAVYTKTTVGTLLYWKPNNLMEALLESLVQKDQSDKRAMEKKQVTVNINRQFPNHESKILSEAKVIIREKIHNLRNKFLYSDIDLCSIDFRNIVHEIDKDLFDFITYISSSDREITNKSSDSANEDKMLKRIYIISSILFTLDNQIRFPCHLLIANIINKYTKSSAECFKLLNKFGVCVSYKTYNRFEKSISDDVQVDLLNFLHQDESGFSVISLDNFNERQRYKAVWHGDGSRGFDGTTCMVVQPAPHTIKAPADQKCIQSNALALPNNNSFVKESNKSKSKKIDTATSAVPIIAVNSLEFDSIDTLQEKLFLYFAVKNSAGDLASGLLDIKTF